MTMKPADPTSIKPIEQRRTPATVVGIAVVILAVAGWADNPLVNPGFEDGGGSLTGWRTFGNSAGNISVSSTTPHSGSYVARLTGPSNSGTATTYSGITQGLATTPGAFWTASAFIRHNPGSRLENHNQLVMKIEFYRRFGGSYGTADFVGETEITVLDANSPTGVWRSMTVGSTAPEDAVEARIAFVFVQHGSDEGVALIDDVSFNPDFGEIGPPQGLSWRLFWHDEFEDNSVDPSKWSVLDAHLIKNDELQYYDPDDVYIEDGRLVLRSRQHDPPVIRPHPDGHNAEFEFTSGLVESAELFSHTFGWIEVRATLPTTQGIWPAHWMLGASFPWIGWPRCGEIDIMEYVGHDVDTVHFSRHWGDPYTHRGTSFSGPNFSEDFHTYAIHWTAEELSWYVDGALRYRTSITDAGEVYRRPFYLILNTAVGGHWPGPPDHTTVFPQYHEIDYVRWYVESEPGDFDVDGDIDEDDQDAFADCFTGDGGTMSDPACRFFDVDADTDIDCDDWDNFTETWTSYPPKFPFLSECRTPQTRRIGGRHSGG
jgi:beta-glucanase (GH16 family)